MHTTLQLMKIHTKQLSPDGFFGPSLNPSGGAPALNRDSDLAWTRNSQRISSANLPCDSSLATRASPTATDYITSTTSGFLIGPMASEPSVAPYRPVG